MGVFGQIRHFSTLFIADTHWNPSKYVCQLGPDGIKYILNKL
jgi:hypothetical protein